MDARIRCFEYQHDISCYPLGIFRILNSEFASDRYQLEISEKLAALPRWMAITDPLSQDEPGT